MGSSSSKITERIAARFRGTSTEQQQDPQENENAAKKGQYLVRSRKGSMFRDEDGDLAHEFYVEVSAKSNGTTKSSMIRVTDNLTPQGDVLYRTARLPSDFPYIVSSR